jgi:translocation-and-assembly-module (TAM) inner membrane subunit TamB-like protein
MFSKFPRLAKTLRASAIALSVVIAIVAALVVSAFTIDLGPALRERAERAGSNQIKRPMHIGKLSIRLLRGEFVLENFSIEGLKPTDRPFFKARTLVVSMPLAALLHREVLIDWIEMRDWEMLTETFPNGTHNFPKFTSGTPGGRKRFTTTLRHLEAHNGTFTFEDHSIPWSVVAPNLNFTLDHIFDYRGEARFSGGTVAIQKYLPMSADLHTWFKIIGGKVHLERIDLITDGAKSDVTGDVDFAHWPEQIYNVHSKIHFPRMREIFFANEKFSLHGEGTFDGTFHLFKGGRELRGRFASPVLGINDYRFPDFKGSLVWLPDRFVVYDATASVYGGLSRFTYSMAPFGKRGVPTMARFDAAYADVDLGRFTDFLETQGIRLAGSATGRNLLEWPLGKYSQHRGSGSMTIRPPAGVAVQQPAAVAPLAGVSDDERYGREWGPFNKRPLLAPVPVGGELTYAFGPEWVDVKPSHLASTRTYVAFEGRTAYGEQSELPFHVTSADWEESDRLLAGILTAFGSATGAVPIGGRGQFDGVMVGSFKAPRIVGRFEGQAMRAWDVVWGSGSADIVIENGYLDVKKGVLERSADSRINAEGRFSLGYPRKDRGEELDARISLVRADLKDLRHAFGLDDYEIEGLISGDVRLSDRYEAPIGYGKMTIEQGTAYGEPFEHAEGSLRFEGTGVRLDGFTAAKGTGTITGAALVEWAGHYTFTADGQRVPLETVHAVAYPELPFSGRLEFKASGSGTFDEPRYDVELRVNDLFVADEGIGQVTGTLSVRGETLALTLDAASPRLGIQGSGTIGMSPEMDADLTFRFTDTSIDPYVRTVRPALSPFTTAIASGTLRVVGELADVDQLLVDGTVDSLRLSLFDYKLQNQDPFHLVLDRHVVRSDLIRLVGQGTRLDLSGNVGLHDRRIDVKATGSANLGILQGFFRDVRSSGQAELQASLQGPLESPLFTGSARLTDGRLRHIALPHSLSAINGGISFDQRAIRVDDVVAKLGEGNVRFGGRVSMTGYVPDDINLTATGEGMHLRYPADIRSIVDADLALVGKSTAPRLTGTVTVKSAVWDKQIDPSGNFFQLAGSSSTVVGGAPASTPTLPLTFDVRVIAPSTFRIANKLAKITSTADLTLQGTYDRPILLGHVEIDRGELTFEGRRYVITRGGIDFNNPARIEPFIDVEAETNVRVPQQTYRVTLQASGRAALQTGAQQGMRFTLNSDPPLSQIDIITLLFGDVRSVSEMRDTELRSLRTQQTTEDLLKTRAARLLTAPIVSEVGRVVEQTFGVDTFQLTPLLVDPYTQSSRITPTAQVMVGKRVSDRVYLTYSQSLSSTVGDRVIMLEFDQSERLSWVLTRNENETYSLDVRVRRAF